MNIKKKLGNKIREIRISRTLTQEALAEKINLSAKSLSQIELGNNFISAETLEAICIALNINPNVLFDFKSPQASEIAPIEEIVTKLNNNPQLLKIIHKIVLALD